MKWRGLNRSGVREISVWLSRETGDVEVTFHGATAETLADLIDAGAEGVELVSHDRWFTSSLSILRAAGLEIEVLPGPNPSWLHDATGARFALKTALAGHHRVHGDEFSRHPYVPRSRPAPPRPPWSPFRSGRR